MRKSVRGTLSTALLVATIALTAPFAGQASADTAGAVHFIRSANTSFDQFTASPSPGAQAWLRSHLWRTIVYSPYFDTRTAWYPNGWVYDDAYAIYTGQSLASAHPEWILKDAQGNRLYIPFGCGGGSCPQYAADIGDPAFRRYWIESLKARVAHGYKGVFVDDVNMDMRVGDGQGQAVSPIDPATGQPMGQDAWRHYMATFMGEVRAALPSVEIVHNAIWYAAEHAGVANPDIRAEISAANFVNLERGANDSGLTGGSGAWSLNALFSYVDQIHGLARNVILDGSASDAKGMEYELGAYLLLSAGNDAVSAGAQTPTNWWAGWGTNLGEASAPRYAWQNLLRRDFSGGMVLLNPPGEPTRTVSLQSPMRDAGGGLVSSVTLAGKSGAVLRRRS